MSYDLILGRDWCEANGVIIDFSKQKIYLINQLQQKESIKLINRLVDPIYETKIAPSKYEHFTQQVSVQPFHEAFITIQSNSNNSLSFAKCYEPLLQRCGEAVVKGII